MDELDLNIQNYDLQDLLHLFKIPFDFTEDHLRSAKKMVLMTHPDKSRLDPKYFRFYTHAYKMIYSIWEFKQKQSQSQAQNTHSRDEPNPKNRRYGFSATEINPEVSKLYKEQYTMDKERVTALDKLIQKKMKQGGAEGFHQWFNEQFEKNQLKTEDQEYGYGSWLSSNEDLDPERRMTQVEMAQEIERKKAMARSLVVKKDYDDMYLQAGLGGGLGAASQLGGSAPQDYSSDLFSSLPYEDLKKAHTETVVPVTMEDYYQRPVYKSINEYQHARSSQEITPFSEIQAREYLKNKERWEDKEATKRAYQLAKQTEESQRKNQDFWAGLQKLK